MEIDSTLDLRRRLTHRYTGDCQDEDEWESYGSVRIADILRGSDEHCTDPSQMPRICLYVEFTLDSDFTALHRTFTKTMQRNLADALHDTFHCSGCSHSHDCCGCVSTCVSSVHLDGEIQEDNTGMAWIHINQYRNY